MVSANESGKVKEFIENVDDFVARAVRIRKKIFKRRIRAVKILRKNIDDPEGLKLLRSCFRRERDLMNVISRNLAESRTLLESYHGWYSRYIKNTKVKKNLDRFLEYFKIFDERVQIVKLRLEAEEAFAAKGDKDSFEALLAQWKAEMRENKSLPAELKYISRFETFFGATRSKINIVLSAAGSITIIYFVNNFFNNPNVDKPWLIDLINNAGKRTLSQLGEEIHKFLLMNDYDELLLITSSFLASVTLICGIMAKIIKSSEKLTKISDRSLRSLGIRI